MYSKIIVLLFFCSPVVLGDDDEDCGDSTPESYNLDLAIASVFVLWVVSFLGAAFPLLLLWRRSATLRLAVKLGAFAGSGVMLAVGFVHMLGDASENLSSPCLPESWNDAYDSWGLLFVVITIVILQALDYLLFIVMQEIEKHSQGNNNDDVEEIPIERTFTLEVIHSRQFSGTFSQPKCNGDVIKSLSPEKRYRALLTKLIVSEVSIGIHSVLIGIALGVTSSSSFVSLFIAIIFHQVRLLYSCCCVRQTNHAMLLFKTQFFEGIALGSSASEFGIGGKLILVFALIYSVMTPIGVAVGIGIRESLNVNSSAYLLVTGILDAIAAGALIYLSLADHMNAVKSQALWLRIQPVLIQLLCFASYFAGAAIMLVIGIWA